MPRPSDVVHIGPDASPQFRCGCDFLMRVTGTAPATYDPAWIHLTGYQLDENGVGVERRTVYVRLAGLRPVGAAPAVRRPTNQSPSIPRQRTSAPARTRTRGGSR